MPTITRPSVIACLALSLGLSACSFPSAPTVTPTRQPLPSPSDTQMPTPIPSATGTPSRTPAPTLTPTITPTPGPDFEAASVYAVAHLASSRLMVTISVPGGVEGIYDVFIGDSRYPCETLPEYPDRLYCTGPEPYVNYSPEGARVRLFPLYPEDPDQPLFEATITVPARPTPTITLTPVPMTEIPFPLILP